jgi:hypothetical protein
MRILDAVVEMALPRVVIDEFSAHFVHLSGGREGACHLLPYYFLGGMQVYTLRCRKT